MKIEFTSRNDLPYGPSTQFNRESYERVSKQNFETEKIQRQLAKAPLKNGKKLDILI